MDEQENVDAGSQTSGEQAAETSQETTAAETTDTSADTSAETSADAGGAAGEEGGAGAATGTEPHFVDEGTPTGEPADESRTGFADKGLRTGDACTCPDGRKGTVHSFDAGFVCIPNHDQSE